MCDILIYCNATNKITSNKQILKYNEKKQTKKKKRKKAKKKKDRDVVVNLLSKKN